MLHTYAASALICSGVSCAPPIGGIGLRYSFGCDTPSVIVFVITAKLPSLHSHFLFFPASGGPKGVPSPLSPWQPVQAAPPTWPWYIRLPSATIAGVAPSGTAAFPFDEAAAPASGCVPSGGFAAATTGSPGAAVKLGHGVTFAAPPSAPPR